MMAKESNSLSCLSPSRLPPSPPHSLFGKLYVTLYSALATVCISTRLCCILQCCLTLNAATCKCAVGAAKFWHFAGNSLVYIWRFMHTRQQTTSTPTMAAAATAKAATKVLVTGGTRAPPPVFLMQGKLCLQPQCRTFEQALACLAELLLPSLASHQRSM